MKSKAIFIVLMIIIGTASFISYSFMGKGMITDGTDQTIESFNKITVGGCWDVFISNAANSTIRMEGTQEDIDRIKYEVKNGTLEIKNKTDHEQCKGPVKIYVTTNDLQAISLGGSGLIKLEQKFTNSTSMDISLAGSGKIEGEISSPDVDVDIAGSGDIVLSGDTKQVDIDIAGSGKFDGKNFKADKADIDVAGSGDAYLTVNSELEAEIAGSGNIYYSGSPQIKKEIAGSGDLIRN